MIATLEYLGDPKKEADKDADKQACQHPCENGGFSRIGIAKHQYDDDTGNDDSQTDPADDDGCAIDMAARLPGLIGILFEKWQAHDDSVL